MKFLPPSLEAKLLERLLGLFGCGLSSWFPLGRGLFSLSIRPYLCLSHTLVGYVQAQFTAQRLGPRSALNCASWALISKEDSSVPGGSPCPDLPLLLQACPPSPSWLAWPVVFYPVAASQDLGSGLHLPSLLPTLEARESECLLPFVPFLRLTTVIFYLDP